MAIPAAASNRSVVATWRLSARGAQVLAALQRMPAEDQDVIEPLLPRSVRKELHDFRVRAAVKSAAAVLCGADCRQWPVAGKLRDALKRYAASAAGSCRDHVPADPLRAALDAVLSLSPGKVRSQRQLYRFLTDKLGPEMSVTK